MPNISEHETDAEREKVYRRGYVHGVQAMISGIVDKLSYDERQTLGVWFANVLTPWSQGTAGSFLPPDAPRLG
jgi:hypothetical protein